MVRLPQNISFKPLFKEVLVAELKVGFLLLICTCSGQSIQTSQPQLVTAMVGDDVVLPCHVEISLKADELAVEWGRPDLNPRYVHLWFEGSEYNDDQNIAYKGRTSLFTYRLKDGDASLRLKGVKHSDNGRFRCYDAKQIEEYFVDLLVDYVFGVRFPCIMPLPLSLNAVLGLSLSLVLIIFIWKWRQTKISMKNLKDKVNKEKQHLMTVEKDFVARKMSDLEEYSRKRNQDQRIIDQQIEALMMMSEELKEKKERLTNQKEEAKEIFEENEKKLKAVDDEVTNHKENKMEKMAQGYFKLKEIISESNERPTKRKVDHQHVELMTEKLIEKTSQEVKKLKERKHEIENHVVELEKHLRHLTDM